MKEIAAGFGIHYSMVSRVVSRLQGLTLFLDLSAKRWVLIIEKRAWLGAGLRGLKIVTRKDNEGF